MMDGVGGSERTAEDVEKGKVNPEPLSDDMVHLESGLLMEIAGKTGLLAEELERGFFS